MPTTEVILTENIRGLGAEADIVKVKRGFARNYLLPTGRAYELTAASLRRLNHLKTKRAEREAGERNAAEEVARRINKLKLTLILETGTQGKAFGSVTARDLEEALKKELPGIELERHAIQLERPIKDTGDHEVPVRLYPEVVAQLKVSVRPKVDPNAVPAAETPAPAETAAPADQPPGRPAGSSSKRKTSS